MKLFNRSIACLLMLSLIGLYCPNTSFCENNGGVAEKNKKKITKHEPKIMSTAEEDISAMPGNKSKLKSKWLWVGLGAVLVGGLVAASGGGGSSGGSEPPTKDDGSLTVGW